MYLVESPDPPAPAGQSGLVVMSQQVSALLRTSGGGSNSRVQDVGKPAFLRLDDGAGVMGDPQAQHGVGVLGVAQVTGAVEWVEARRGKAGRVAYVVQPRGGFQQIGVSARNRYKAALLPERTTPELLLREAKYAALTSYGAAATLLSEAFPLGRALHATAVRQQVERTATRLEDELGEERVSFIDTCPAEWEELPRPGLPLVVALDGGYVHSSQQTSRKDGWFEAVTGTSTPGDGGPAKTFAWVQTYDEKPKRRLYELLRSQGMQDNQQVVFLTDGGEDVRDIPRYLNPQAEHYLDWFHITMRLTVLRQMTRSLPPRPAGQTMTMTRPGSRTPARPTGTWSGSSTSCGTATPSARWTSWRTSATTSRSPGRRRR